MVPFDELYTSGVIVRNGPVVAVGSVLSAPEKLAVRLVKVKRLTTLSTSWSCVANPPVLLNVPSLSVSRLKPKCPEPAASVDALLLYAHDATPVRPDVVKRRCRCPPEIVKSGLFELFVSVWRLAILTPFVKSV